MKGTLRAASWSNKNARFPQRAPPKPAGLFLYLRCFLVNARLRSPGGFGAGIGLGRGAGGGELVEDRLEAAHSRPTEGSGRARSPRAAARRGSALSSSVRSERWHGASPGEGRLSALSCRCSREPRSGSSRPWCRSRPARSLSGARRRRCTASTSCRPWFRSRPARSPSGARRRRCTVVLDELSPLVPAETASIASAGCAGGAARCA